MVTLVKDYKQRQFSEKAAKIAIEHFGWSEITTPAKPSEVGTKTKPPIIDKPIKLKEIPIEKKEIVSDDLGVRFTSEDQVDSVNDDSGTAKGPVKEILSEIQNTEATPVKVKKPRKSPVKSKSK